MNLYLDDDSASPLLARLFNQAGHDVQLPRDAVLFGADDPVHLTHTIRANRVCLSGNHDDFLILHNLVMEAQGHHPGVIIVRRDNNPRRDLSPRGIVHALGNLLAANVLIADQFIILNHWR